jgi:hypothetical protein
MCSEQDTHMRRSTGKLRFAAEDESRARLRQLLRRRPLPLRRLVKEITADPALVTVVLGAAADESGTRLHDVESAVVLLGAEGLRAALARRAEFSLTGGEARRRGGGPHAGRMQALRKAIAGDRYRVHPRAIAAAMLRELRRE